MIKSKKLFFRYFKEELRKFDWNCCKIVFREMYFLVYIKGLVYYKFYRWKFVIEYN